MKHASFVTRMLIDMCAPLTALIFLVSTAHAAEKAGIAGGVVGTVMVSGGGRAAPQPLKSGMPVMVGDRVQSGPGSRLQIMLVDETVFTLGPDSDLVIDELVYDPASGNAGKMRASTGKGLLYYVSGQVAKANPGGVSIKTSSTILGVRGTALFVMNDPQSTTGAQFIGLMGPGNNNNGNLKSGGMTVGQGGNAVDVNRAGFGVFTSPGQPVGDPQKTPANFTQQMAMALTGPIPGPGQTGDAPNEMVGDTDSASGQDMAQAGISVLQTEEVIDAIDDAFDITEQSSEENNDDVLEQIADQQPEPSIFLPLGIAIPAMIELSWASPGPLDFDLHLTGPDADPAAPAGSRFHIFSGNTGSYGFAPFAALDNNASGITGSEVIGISQFTPGQPYRVEIDGVGIAVTALSNPANNLQIRYVTNGTLTRGPNGSSAINGTEVIKFSPNQGQQGSNWTAFDITTNNGPEIVTSNVITNVAAGTFP